MSRLDVLPMYLQRIEDMASRLARFNMILDMDTRADIAYIQRYAAEARRIVHLELLERGEQS